MHDQTEELRLREFDRVNPVATASEASFDLITSLVREVFAGPAVAISLLDEDTQYLKARQGVELKSSPRCNALCNYVVASGQPLVVEDLTQDPRARHNPFVTGPARLRFYAGAPLTTSSGQHLGALCLFDTQPRQLDTGQMNILSRFATLVSDQLELRAQVERDFLTNALNRRGFEGVLRREMDLIRAGAPAATLAMLDLDHFKQVNDTYGHPVGDQVLRKLTDLIVASVRAKDHVARLGGEEFAVLLPEMPIDKGADVLERLREAVAAQRMEHHPDLTLSVSVGLIDITAHDRDPEILMRDVDEAVYLAKSRGRNQIVIAPEGHPMRTARQVAGPAELAELAGPVGSTRGRRAMDRSAVR